MRKTPKTVAIVGTGPAGLMAASRLSSAKNVEIHLFDKRPGPGRKLLIAGSSGLNITYDAPLETFHEHYFARQKELQAVFRRFSCNDWLKFINDLGLETFLGTSRRYFVKEMKAAGLLSAWTDRLERAGVQFHFEKELTDINPGCLTFNSKERFEFDAAVLALGGGSYEKPDSLNWPKLLKSKGLAINPLKPSNVGFEVHWPKAFLEKNDRIPLKNIILKTARGKKQGDVLITEYGLEGTPVYFTGCEGKALLDLKPDLSLEEIEKKLTSGKEKRMPLREAERSLKLAPTALDLLFHLGRAKEITSAAEFAVLVKNLPVTLENPRPLEEAISSSGGVAWDELTSDLESKKLEGVFLAGELIDWDAPTGGFLIQACVSQGVVAAEGVLKKLS